MKKGVGFVKPTPFFRKVFSTLVCKKHRRLNEYFIKSLIDLINQFIR